MYITLQKHVLRCRGEADSVLWRMFFCWFSKKLPSPPPSNPHIIEPLAPSNAPTRHFWICWQTKACHRKGTSITFLTTRSQNYIQKFWVLVRQRCCLIICSYIGWIDKYWDGGSNPSQGFAAFSKGQSAFRPIFFGDLALPHEESNIWNSFQFISINIQALRGASPLIFKTWASTPHQNCGSTLIGQHRQALTSTRYPTRSELFFCYLNSTLTIFQN